MLTRGKLERGVVEMVDTESLVPPDHLLRKIDAAVDFGKLYELVEPLYSEEDGRYSIDPVVLFKIVLLQHLDGIASLRGTLRRAQTDVAYRWFLGYTLSEELPHFSTVSYNFRQQMAKGCAASGVEKIRLHDLRHSHASLLIHLGVPVLLVSERLGHEDVETTLRTYGHLYPSTSTEAVEKLDN